MNLPVWLYWEGEKPEWITLCQNTIFAHADNVRLITPARFDDLRKNEKEIALSHLSVAHRADFIRAFLLAKFGGLWIDSDCVVMKSLLPLCRLLNEYDFIGYRERNGLITNNFMGACANSRIAAAYYENVCDILRSDQEIEWLTLGSNALTPIIENSGIPWYEMETELIQPICWSNQEAFFARNNDAGHEILFNDRSYCYMVAANMLYKIVEENPSVNLLEKDSFFSFLLRKSCRKSGLLSVSSEEKV